MFSAYLNTLYQELTRNSPRQLSLAIPAELGSGRIAQLETKQGMVLSDWQLRCAADLSVEGVDSQAYVQMIFCLEEGLTWKRKGCRSAWWLQTGECCLRQGYGELECAQYAKERAFHFKSVKIPQVYFNQLLETYFEAQELSLYRKKVLDDDCKARMSPYMAHILAEINEFERLQGGLGCLFLESKVLELTALYLREVLEEDIIAANRPCLSREDREGILWAKRLIDTQLAYAPSCAELAQQVHMSVSKLSRGFQDMVGRPIHTYVIDLRLEKAASLLLEGELSIAQVAALVGYTKPSNFAAAFRKKYGVLPKEYRKGLLPKRLTEE